ncbi:MAG TPA: SDR family NAD(P)-dependent oxidoreductase [Thermoanaerobaculia bacterium]|jgi:NAD(P)-dependent dehydrogenase (short-subunit alcohol dehydrogenase family)|nr:SDR family NAD(P)-dependent oxidoreductase [Thermoanaerobaculia bacterium]
MRLEGKVALITGGGSGIGEAAAVLFAKEGAKVAILGRTREKLEETVRRIEEAGGEALAIEGDVSKYPDMERVVSAVVERWGRLDVLFANAGVNGVWAPIDELAPEEWEKTVAINLTGTFFSIKAAVPRMKERGGSIVVTSSVNGTRMFSNGGASAYATTKAGQVALTQMLAVELARHRIRVNVICPGAIETEIEESTEKRDVEEAREPVEYPQGVIPLTDGKPGKAEQVARLVLFLASDESDHITGTPVWIDGGQSLLQG